MAHGSTGNLDTHTAVRSGHGLVSSRLADDVRGGRQSGVDGIRFWRRRGEFQGEGGGKGITRPGRVDDAGGWPRWVALGDTRAVREAPSLSEGYRDPRDAEVSSEDLEHALIIEMLLSVLRMTGAQESPSFDHIGNDDVYTIPGQGRGVSGVGQHRCGLDHDESAVTVGKVDGLANG